MSAAGSSVISGASRWLAPSAAPVPRASTRPAPTTPDLQGLVFIPVILPRWLLRLAARPPPPPAPPPPALQGLVFLPVILPRWLLGLAGRPGSAAHPALRALPWCRMGRPW